MAFNSKVFQKEKSSSAAKRRIVRGGRHLFPLLPKAFDGIKQIGVIGWGSQGPAQAQNLRDSLAGTGIKVKVGLRDGLVVGQRRREARLHRAERHARRDVRGRSRESDMVLLLIADAAQAELLPKIFESLRPGATLGLSHGFLLGHLRNVGASISRRTST